jgi:hypothetical protein
MGGSQAETISVRRVEHLVGRLRAARSWCDRTPSAPSSVNHGKHVWDDRRFATTQQSDFIVHCSGTMLACRATSCQRPLCFIHIPVKRRCSVFPAFGIFPPHTTVSLPAAITVSPQTRTYSMCRSPHRTPEQSAAALREQLRSDGQERSKNEGQANGCQTSGSFWLASIVRFQRG